MSPRWSSCRVTWITICLLKELTTDRASHDKHPIQSCQQHSALSSCECFCVSVLFILPPSLLCSEAYRVSQADWLKEVLASAREAWLTSLRWKSAGKDFTVILRCAEGSKIAEVWCVYELALTLRDRTCYTVLNACFTAVVCSIYWMVFISS